MANRQPVDPARANSEGEASRALDGGTRLHALALRYWADERLDDALRIDLQAAQLVGALDPTPELLSEIISTIDAIRRDLEGTELASSD